MKSGKLLKISDERSIFIIQNEDGSYISTEMQINYRNIGTNFDHRLTQDAFVNITDKGIVEVLDAAGKAKFHFPAVWLDTNYMKFIELQESGLLKAE